jgi:type II secretory ATPase GspE/PulE/Tfp pilus assembly ATPase PilB-like protein
VRRLCTQCVTSRPATADEVNELADDWLHAWGESDGRPAREELLDSWTERHGKDGRLRFHHASGCKACDNSGFRGRVAIHELMEISRELRRLVQTGTRAELIQRTAITEGLRTLRQDGIEKVLAGHTSIEEVRASSNS